MRAEQGPAVKEKRDGKVDRVEFDAVPRLWLLGLQRDRVLRLRVSQSRQLMNAAAAWRDDTQE